MGAPNPSTCGTAAVAWFSVVRRSSNAALQTTRLAEHFAGALPWQPPQNHEILGVYLRERNHPAREARSSVASGCLPNSCRLNNVHVVNGKSFIDHCPRPL